MASQSNWEQYFDGRRWRLAAEKDGEVPPVTFTHGTFEIDRRDGGVFHSPVSTARGRKGYLLQELDGEGRDIDGSVIAVGEIVYRRALAEGAVRE